MTKTIIWIVVIVIIAGGGYFAYMKYMTGSPQPASQTSTTTTTTTNATTTPQVQAQDKVVGTGAEAGLGSVVSVLYTGQLTDGTVFDSSAAHGNQPLQFAIGTPNLIVGFQVGVNGMRVGGERLIAIPPALGYGDQDVKDASGKVIIPANSTLVFDIKLVGVQAASSTATTTTATQ
jgi:FKBP-type peptidyl-prolyl cis-trans isomerase